MDMKKFLDVNEVEIKLSKEELQKAIENNIGVSDIREWLSNNNWSDGEICGSKDNKNWRIKTRTLMVEREPNFNVGTTEELFMEMAKTMYFKAQVLSLEEV